MYPSIQYQYFILPQHHLSLSRPYSFFYPPIIIYSTDNYLIFIIHYAFYQVLLSILFVHEFLLLTFLIPIVENHLKIILRISHLHNRFLYLYLNIPIFFTINTINICLIQHHSNTNHY